MTKDKNKISYYIPYGVNINISNYMKSWNLQLFEGRISSGPDIVYWYILSILLEIYLKIGLTLCKWCALGLRKC